MYWSVGVLLMSGTSACGYTLVKKNDLRFQRYATDSVRIANLETEATQLRVRIRSDSAKIVALTAKATTVLPTSQDSVIRARDEEIASLRDQLAKAQTELDRIKRRLANPRS